MAKFHKPKLLQKIAGYIGNIGINTIKIKQAITHPHEELISKGFGKFQEYGKKNTGLKGQIRDRRQFYNKKTDRFVKIDTRTGKILGSSKNPYKRIRRGQTKRRRRYA